ncbi:c-Myc-binding protein homolog [Harmonia axyridis]|uniref:c-Myc-binding protein homolog n=1 Tax=Harmonia axyridis TaxID=115357 RepID=UPI001E27542C|nr:c-Myc-binding protein homolog [Harmonia axyridis]
MSANQTFKPSEGKREEFRKYLEKNGVMDALTKVLVNLYEETDKPDDALEFIRDKLAIHAGLDTHKQMKTKLEDAHEQISQLEAEIENLKAALEEKQKEKSVEDQEPQDAPKPED